MSKAHPALFMVDENKEATGEVFVFGGHKCLEAFISESNGAMRNSMMSESDASGHDESTVCSHCGKLLAECVSAPITDEAFVKAGGNKCPHCKSGNINSEATKSQYDGATILVPCDCEDCGREWNDRLVLDGWESA